MLEFNFSPFPVLKTSRLILRDYIDSDLDTLFLLRSDPRVIRYIDREPDLNLGDTLKVLTKLRSQLQENKAISWAIAPLSEPANIIGYIGYWRTSPENHRAEVGYALHPDEWRKGYTKEALQTVIQYGFSEMKLHSIEAKINPLNLISAKTLLSCGFKQEAHFKEDYFFKGKFLDTVVFSLLHS